MNFSIQASYFCINIFYNGIINIFSDIENLNKLKATLSRIDNFFLIKMFLCVLVTHIFVPPNERTHSRRIYLMYDHFYLSQHYVSTLTTTKWHFGPTVWRTDPVPFVRRRLLNGWLLVASNSCVCQTLTFSYQQKCSVLWVYSLVSSSLVQSESVSQS